MSTLPDILELSNIIVLVIGASSVAILWIASVYKRDPSLQTTRDSSTDVSSADVSISHVNEQFPAISILAGALTVAMSVGLIFIGINIFQLKNIV
jgi:hypothetical protein